MIAFATSAVRERPGAGYSRVASVLLRRELSLFAVLELSDDSGAIELASAALFEELQTALSENDRFEAAFARVNLRFAAHVAAHPQESGGGASLAVVRIARGAATVAHVGAMNAFLVHDGGVERIAIAHTLDEERAARKLPATGRGEENVWLRALGSPNHKPEVVTRELVPGDRLALVTDSVARAHPHAARADLLRGPLEHIADRLVAALPTQPFQVGAAVVIHLEG